MRKIILLGLALGVALPLLAPAAEAQPFGPPGYYHHHYHHHFWRHHHRWHHPY
ncbi:hypothetical protein [Lichenicola sp.]|uniref:hypothetical protein n=1 Tax=Lichenicola sp. TaxID=2804529 RepID=UPI003AFF7DF3